MYGIYVFWTKTLWLHWCEQCVIKSKSWNLKFCTVYFAPWHVHASHGIKQCLAEIFEYVIVCPYNVSNPWSLSCVSTEKQGVVTRRIPMSTRRRCSCSVPCSNAFLVRPARIPEKLLMPAATDLQNYSCWSRRCSWTGLANTSRLLPSHREDSQLRRKGLFLMGVEGKQPWVCLKLNDNRLIVSTRVFDSNPHFSHAEKPNGANAARSCWKDISCRSCKESFHRMPSEHAIIKEPHWMHRFFGWLLLCLPCGIHHWWCPDVMTILIFVDGFCKSCRSESQSWTAIQEQIKYGEYDNIVFFSEKHSHQRSPPVESSVATHQSPGPIGLPTVHHSVKSLRREQILKLGQCKLTRYARLFLLQALRYVKIVECHVM